MKISGLTIVCNAVKYDYPVVEAIRAILPVCDEFIVGIGESTDGTRDLIRSINSPKIKIFEAKWDFSKGPQVLSEQTNLALAKCTGDWVFYVQADELIHEDDLPRLKKIMEDDLNDKDVDALRFKYLHFYGNYYRYRIDAGWFQKQDRIIRNNGTIESYGDAYAFRRKDGNPLKTRSTGCLLYHYGWVHSGEVVTQRRANHKKMGFEGLENLNESKAHDFGELDRFPVYFGSHPLVMKERIGQHALSQADKIHIDRKYWWFPPKIMKLRYKTSRRVKQRMS